MGKEPIESAWKAGLTAMVRKLHDALHIPWQSLVKEY
jgi:hypothetical protein